jgi:hypothetical protein
MSNPEIATILEDGTYGQRPMTDAEYADYLEAIKEPSLEEPSDDATR